MERKLTSTDINETVAPKPQQDGITLRSGKILLPLNFEKQNISIILILHRRNPASTYTRKGEKNYSRKAVPAKKHIEIRRQLGLENRILRKIS